MITHVPTRIELIQQLPAHSIGAEIGVWKGYFSIQILNETSVKKLYLVDAWVSQPSYNDPLSDTDHEANLIECKEHIRGHKDRWAIVRGDSLAIAAKDRTIPPLDWVFIDSDHSFQACLADLIAWSARLKPDGRILGHDFTSNSTAKKYCWGVIEAVEYFCNAYGWEIEKLTDEDFASYQLRPKAWRGAEL